MQDEQTYRILCEMSKQIAMISAQLAELVKIARADHPRTFTQAEPRPAAPREAPPTDRPDRS